MNGAWTVFLGLAVGVLLFAWFSKDLLRWGCSVVSALLFTAAITSFVPSLSFGTVFVPVMVLMVVIMLKGH